VHARWWHQWTDFVGYNFEETTEAFGGDTDEAGRFSKLSQTLFKDYNRYSETLKS
jgi:hypothetical protein